MPTRTSDRVQLTPLQRKLIAAVATGGALIAMIGFLGSYAAVRHLAEAKHFGTFAAVFPIGIDAGILVLLALDLLLTWLRMTLPLLRQTAWLLTAATIVFNAAAAWPDPIGVGMHAVIPVLFVVVVEAARHAIGVAADITADRHMDSVRWSRWLLAPLATFRLWRRMKLWELRSYDQVIALEQSRLIERARLRARYGRRWRSKAPVNAVMALRLTRYGRSLTKPITGELEIEHTPNTGPLLAVANTNTRPAAITARTFETVAAEAIAVVREPEHEESEQPLAVTSSSEHPPNSVREQVANKAATSPNGDRPTTNTAAANTPRPNMATLVREQIADTPNNATAVRNVLAIMPGANKASVAAAVRRERRKVEMSGGYG